MNCHRFRLNFWKPLLALALLAPLAGARDLPAGVAWIHEFREPIQSEVVVAGELAIVLVGKDMCALRACDGTLVWKVPVGRGGLELREGLVVYREAWRQHFYDPKDGHLVWEFSHDQCLSQSTPGRIWYVSKGQMFAREVRTGKILWQRTQPEGMFEFWPDQEGFFASFQGYRKVERHTFAGQVTRLAWTAEAMRRTRAGWLVTAGLGTSLVNEQGRVLWNRPGLHTTRIVGQVLVGTQLGLEGIDLTSGRRLWQREHYYSRFALDRFLVLNKWNQLVFCDARSGATVRRIYGDHNMRPVATPDSINLLAWPGTLTRYRKSDLREITRWPSLIANYSYEVEVPDGSYGGGRSYHPYHTTLAVLGAGSGQVTFDGPPELELLRHRDGILVKGRNLRQVELALYAKGELVERRLLKLPAADPGSSEICKFAVAHGTYQLVARSRGLLTRQEFEL